MGRRTRINWSFHNKWTYASILLIVLLSVIVALRYKAALSVPNFYAEDGTVFLQNILDKGMLGATLTAFNGYLVVGQYLVLDIAYGVYSLFGLHFSSLPLLIAAASCLFLGLTASLPFILFRKEMGWAVALITSVLLAFTPLYGSDYAVIGTIGNLKFAFLFWAVLFVIYRNINYRNSKKTILSDVILLICVLTNGPVVAVLPYILWPYRRDLKAMVASRSITKGFLKRYDVVSGLLLAAISLVYLAVVYFKGIPKIANYLDGPYVWRATDNLVYRVTEYGWFYPISKSMSAISVAVTLVIILALALWLNRQRRVVFLFGIYAIAIGTLAFVVTRPGIGNYLLLYEKFPDQFFYAQTMIFVFITMWIIAPYVRTKRQQILAFGIVVLYLAVSAPFASSYGMNRLLYSQRPDIYQAISQSCQQKAGKVTIKIYPTPLWNLTVERSVACE